MIVTKSEVRPGAYYDSVVLMQLQRALADLPGVLDAGVVMATPANCDLLAASGLNVESKASSDDLLLVVKAQDEDAANQALAQVDELLTKRRGHLVQDYRPRSLDGAIKQLPTSQWVLISVPGRFAAAVAREALDLNQHVFIFSDNVSLEDEVALKRVAYKKGLLVMGPDCGTAIVNGVGLGFANRVRRGGVGLVGASGTGLQAITAGIHNLGAGISHAFGTGGRDLKASVGAITTRQALDLLNKDKETRVIVIVSKPPEPDVVVELLKDVSRIDKPVVINFIGYPPPGRSLDNIYFASDLGDAAALAVNLLTADSDRWPKSTGGDTTTRKEWGYLRGLFSGGTLAYEAMLGLQNFLSSLYSNVPLDESQRLEDLWSSKENTVLDLGEDDFTQGRLHPMIDNDLRLRRLEQEAADPEVSFILLDVVLGEGAHTDPASEIAPAIAEVITMAQRNGRILNVGIIVVGTDEDPQGVSDQVGQLENAGAVVFRNTTEAVAYIGRKIPQGLSKEYTSVSLKSIQAPFAAINVGLELFYESLKTQGADAVQVDWRPPAGGNEKMMALLAKMK